MTTTTTTRSMAQADDVVGLLRARNNLLWVVTREEARVEGYLIEAAAAAGYIPHTWDVAQGVADMSGKLEDKIGGPDPGTTITAINERANKGTTRDVFIMRDLHDWLRPPIGMTLLRQLRNFARNFAPRESAQAMIVISPVADIPVELSGQATVIEWSLPDRAEIGELLDAAVEAQGDRVEKLTNGVREAAIDAAIGLMGKEAQDCYSRSLVQLKRIEPTLIAKEKKRVIARERVLEWFDPLPGGLDSVGGLDNLKAWMLSRAAAYTLKARAYGLPAPRGALIVGVPGCGKSMICKALATAWGVPLVRLDLGALKSKFVGESEQNLRRALKVIEALGRCIVWIDEIEKALQGATSGSADGGVSSDALGAVLSWMQERQGDAFVLATANDVEALPPELMRKGRFDDVWFVDVPNMAECIAVLTASLRTHGRDGLLKSKKPQLDLVKIALRCDGFTGSEIANLVPDAMFTAFADKEREITTQDLLDAASSVVPLTETSKEKMTKLRDWASKRARPAAAKQETTTKRDQRQRVLDIQ